MSLTDIYPEEKMLWEQIQDKCEIAFDVGINDISHLCHFKHPNNGTKIYLFEPNSSLVKKLIETYGNDSNVHIFDLGFGEEEREVQIHYNSLSIFHRTICHDSAAFSAKIVRLDDFCITQNIQKIDFLKIDAEGYDGRILLGGKEIIKTCKWIQIESFCSIETDIKVKQEVAQLITGMNLYVYRMIGGIFQRKEPSEVVSHNEYCNYLLSKEEFINEL